MKRLQNLIKTLCPEGVEYKTLEAVCELSRGKVYSKTYITANAGDYPVYSSQTANNGELGRISTYDYDGEYLTWTTDGAYAGTIFHRKGKFSITNVCGLIAIKSPNILNIRFLYYWLSIKAQEYVYRGMGNPKLMSNQMAPIEIPIPPLVIQEEIVIFLDALTSSSSELQAELQAELQTRQEQYEYYKQTIFRSVSLHYKVFLLKEIATFSQGIQVDPSLQYDTMKSGRIRFLRIVDFVSDNEPYRYIEKPSDKYIKSENELIMIRYGASAAGKVFMCYSGAIANNMFKINLKPEILPKYVMYYLSQNSIYTLLNSSGGKSTMPAINFKLVGSIHIPIPPYSEQQHIVSILDKFETFVNDLSKGLPAEIAAVQEQYEYYRNKLLSFPRKIKHTNFS